jgi:hypothetical protein
MICYDPLSGQVFRLEPTNTTDTDQSPAIRLERLYDTSRRCNFTNACSPLFIQLAQKELQKMNLYKAPRDKLACILNCCKVINNLLLNASVISNDNPPGADEFLPVLIYVTIKV